MCGVIMMAVKMLLALLLFLCTSFTDVASLSSREIHVKAGEMVALCCPCCRGYDHDTTKVVWMSHTTQKTYVTSNVSSAELTQMGVLLHGRSLVIVSASVNHQGNYTCSMGNSSRQSRFTLTVYTAQSTEYEEKTTFSKTCYAQQSCTLNCPDVTIPAENTPDITSNGITWHKEGESLPKDSFFPSVEEKDHGVYTCTRSYLYHGQTYNRTFTVVLTVKPKKVMKTAVIISPRNNDVFHVDLGSAVVIDCKAVTYSRFDGAFWLSGKSFVNRNANSPVFYEFTREKNAQEIEMTASLVFKKVSEEDIAKNYTCKLESVYQAADFVTITLAQKPRPLYISLAVSLVGIVVVMVVMVVIYVKLKIDISLFLRDTLGCCSTTSDGKSYDAFVMCYKSDTDAGLNAQDRKWRVLEEKLGYSLCLSDRDVLPGDGSLSEALQLLSEAGDCVTWKGISSTPSSSSFWKQLRYHLPAPRHETKIRLLPQTATQDDNC